MTGRLLLATALFFVVLLIVTAPSGAPFRVHVAVAAGLLIAFWLPALVVRRPADVLARWYMIVPGILLGILVWDALSSVAIAKREFFTNAWITYPLGVVAILLLLLLHSMGVQLASRQQRGGRRTTD